MSVTMDVKVGDCLELLREMPDNSVDLVAKLAYCAGVIDSDGCITIKRRRVKSAAHWNCSSSVFVRQVTDEAVVLLQSLFGGRISKSPPSIKGGRDLFHWEANRKRAELVVLAILPYLRIKRRQAELLIDFQKFLRDHKGRSRASYFQWSEDEPCYTIAEACEKKGCGRGTLYQAISQKSIPSKLIRGRGRGARLIPKRFLDEHEFRKGKRPLAREYVEQRDDFRRKMHSLNGPTKGKPSST